MPCRRCQNGPNTMWNLFVPQRLVKGQLRFVLAPCRQRAANVIMGIYANDGTPNWRFTRKLCVRKKDDAGQQTRRLAIGAAPHSAAGVQGVPVNEMKTTEPVAGADVNTGEGTVVLFFCKTLAMKYRLTALAGGRSAEGPSWSSRWCTVCLSKVDQLRRFILNKLKRKIQGLFPLCLLKKGGCYFLRKVNTFSVTEMRNIRSENRGKTMIYSTGSEMSPSELNCSPRCRSM